MLRCAFREGLVVSHKHALAPGHGGRAVLAGLLFNQDTFARDDLQRVRLKFSFYYPPRGFEPLTLVRFQRRTVIAMHATAAQALRNVVGKRRVKHRVRDEDVVDRKHSSNVARGLACVNGRLAVEV